MTRKDQILTVEVADENGNTFTLREVCERGDCHAEFVIKLVNYGIISPVEDITEAREWQFDMEFKNNWKYAKTRLLIRGAYHYYRPDENSTLQAQNFIKNTFLEPGDFVPVLDIEDYPRHQSIEKLIEGVHNWLEMIEKHYGVQPVIYSGENFYNRNLKDHFPNHRIWIAKYSVFNEKMKDDWHFWQFTDKGTVPGVETPVDLNIFKGNRQDIKNFLIQ